MITDELRAKCIAAMKRGYANRQQRIDCVMDRLLREYFMSKKKPKPKRKPKVTDPGDNSYVVGKPRKGK